MYRKQERDIGLYGKLAVLTESQQKQQHIIHLFSLSNTSDPADQLVVTESNLNMKVLILKCIARMTVRSRLEKSAKH